MYEIAVLILSVLVNTVLGLSVYIKNPTRDLNRLFFLLTLSLSAWLIVTYFSIHPSILSQLAWVRLVLSAASVLCFFVLASFAVFPEGEIKYLRFARPAFYYMLFVVALTQTPFVFKSLTYDSAGNAQPVVAPGIAIFMLLALSYLGGAVFLLIRKYRHARGRIKNQLRIVIFGVAASFAAILFANLFLVSLFKNTSLISFSPLLTLILTGSMAYAILKHKLFDLRLAIARAMAYLLTFGLVVLIYAVIAYLIGELFPFGSNSLSTGQRVFYVGLAVATAVAFQPLKKFFDRNTNRIFYKDAYEPRYVIDKLNGILVGNIQLEPMLVNSAKAVADEIKLVGCGFAIKGRQKDPSQYDFLGSLKAGKEDTLTKLVNSPELRHKNYLITDEISLANTAIRNSLVELDCAAIFKLTTHKTQVGYMIVGNKKSGNILSDLDKNVLSIISDELAIAVENALRFEEIQQFNVTLQQKIEEATRELRRVNQRLRELDKTKDEFISMASHQLRTPLTSVKGYLSMVLEGDTGKITKTQKDYTQKAFDGAQKMVYLIADMLNVSRLQTGKFVIENKPTDLAQVVEGEVSQLESTAAEHQIKLEYHKPDKFPVLNLDETKIRQVVMNFVDNAIYYTPAGGSVTVELDSSESEAKFSVTDTGLGVPASVQHHLFSKFYRADNARKVRPDGTGLGLFMAKKVITAQGGAVIFRSTEGKGSTFGFSFPRATTEIKDKKTPSDREIRQQEVEKSKTPA